MNLKQRKLRKLEPIHCRKIERNIFKIANGNNKIRNKWRLGQIHKYGLVKWCSMYNHSVCRSRVSCISPKDFMRA